MSPKPLSRMARFNTLYALVAMFGVVLLHDLWLRSQAVEVIPYSRFQTILREGKVREVEIGRESIAGTLKKPEGGQKPRFVTSRVETDLARELDQHGVTYAARVENNLLPTILSWVVPVLLFFGLWLLLARSMANRLGGPGGGLMSIGKSKARVFVESDVPVRFKDVAGVEEAEAELVEIVNFLRDPSGYGRLGARMPKGILLVGPPGTGKTLLARAVAGEAGVPFFSISGSEFVEMFVGVGAARVRDLFEQARQKAPAIIFIDELDALGRARTSVAGLSGGHDEKEQTLNQLLVEMDGFDSSSGIVLLAATNRPEVLDPALLRAGRFDRQVVVDRPDRNGRLEILKVHAGKVRLAEGVRLEEVAALTPGFTGADLANLINEAALAATRRGADAVALADFNEAIERIVAGLERKTRVLGVEERRRVAWHEMGHALVAAALPGADPVHKVSIIPRGVGALGYTLQRPGEERYLMTRPDMENRLAVLLAGRAAELLGFGQLSSGAADDLARATDIARAMATRFAMVPELGPVAYETAPQGYLGGGPGLAPPRAGHSEQTAREIDCAVRDILDRAARRAHGLLQRNLPLLQDSARLLLERETLDAEAMAGLTNRLAAESPPMNGEAAAAGMTVGSPATREPAPCGRSA